MNNNHILPFCFSVLLLCTFSRHTVYGQVKETHTLFAYSAQKSSSTDQLFLEVNRQALQNILNSNQQKLLISIPTLTKKWINHELVQYELLTKDYTLTDELGNILTNRSDHAKFYTSSKSNKEIAGIQMSIVNNQLYITYFDHSSSYTITPEDNPSDKKNTRYKLKKDNNYQGYTCATKDNYEPQFETAQLSYTQYKKSTGSVSVYIECDYQMYLDNGRNKIQTESIVLSLMNAVAAIYTTEISIQLQISQIKVWTTPDPYEAGRKSSSYDVLNLFSCTLSEIGSYNGRIAHLLSTNTRRHGGIADIKNFCNNSAPLYAYSNIQNHPSSSRLLVAHEIGHNLSAPHTHACAWNGNLTQIDDCGNPSVEGNPCYNPDKRSVPANGTLMSYCGNPNNSNLVHPQVEVKIRNFVNNCLLPLNYSCPTPREEQISITMNRTGTAATIVIDKDSSQYFFLTYRTPTTFGNCICTANSTSNTVQLSDLTPNQEYIITASVTCPLSNSSWSCPVYFISKPNLCDGDIALTGSVNGNYSNKANIRLQDAAIPFSNVLSLTSEKSVLFVPQFTLNLSSTLTINMQDCN